MYLLTKALGEIKSQETKDHLLKWVDLIMMKIPPEFEEQDKKKGTKTVISSKLTTMDIFKHNLERLDIQVFYLEKIFKNHICLKVFENIWHKKRQCTSFDKRTKI